MPIRIDADLPARAIIESENIFVMDEIRASSQDIRPLEILILNLMPTKIATETQLLRLLGNTPLQVNPEFLMVASHKSKNTSVEHLNRFYKTFSEIKDRTFDGMIVTGAPVEQYEFEEVDYWNELCEIMDWSVAHVHSTFFICWGAQAAMYHFFGLQKKPLPKKMFGIFPHRVERKNSILCRGFDDVFMVPQSRHTTVLREDIEKVPQIKIIASSDELGPYIMSTQDGGQIFVTGHSEYDRDTLKKEYDRDKAAGLPIEVPANYFPDDDDTREPIVSWRAHANLLYANWLNYFVYQTTPFDLSKIK
ncbi:MAG: homoserine O-succinyltransferase [Lachnospiraceae bacterium]|nr:homoserine O-succinyltransferase [Lachnospiraceae bacterium]